MNTRTASELLSAIDASFAVSILGTASVVGRLIGGWILTRLATRTFVIVTLIGQTLGLFLFALSETRAMVWTAAGLFGVNMGNLLMLHPLVLAEVYSVQNFPRLYSLGQSFTSVGVACGPLLLGWIYERAGYPFAFAAAGVVSCLALVLFLSSGPAPRDHKT